MTFKELARHGATLRLAELDAERSAILATFPDMASTEVSTPDADDLEHTDDTPTPDKRRRRRTPAERKAISLRMRRYWAKRRRATK